MATITGLTAERMLEIEAASVVDGDIVGNDLILARQDGTIINAGNVRGPIGPEGPMGSALEVITAQPVREVGVANQIRAGRQLAPSDFTNLGLAAPLGLWNLSNANDSSGNGRHLTIRGGVPFAEGINGLASTAAQFVGSAAQSLYIPDSGAADPFRIKVGSWGGWFRSSRRGANQRIISKMASGGAISDIQFDMYVTASGFLIAQAYGGAGSPSVSGAIDVGDDKWHFAVAAYDGSKLRIYIDGVLDSTGNVPGPIAPTTNGPLNIGSAADNGAGGIANIQMYGRISNVFVTSDVLSEEEVRNLFCASIPHALGVEPSVINVSVRKKRRGATLATGDFPSQPLHLYNFTNGAILNEGSSGAPLTMQGGLVPPFVAGPDGVKNNAVAFPGSGYYLQASDAGMPSGLSPRSFGGWFKTGSTGTIAMLGWGVSPNHVRWYMASGNMALENGGDGLAANGLADGLWHHLVEVHDNAPADGLKRKLYLDGKLWAGSLVLNSITLGGANRFKVGANPADGTLPYPGQVDGIFVYAGVLTADQVRALYNKSSQQLAKKPRDPGTFVEAIEAGRILAYHTAIDPVDLVDVAVMS